MQKGLESDFKCNDFAKCQDEEENERDFVITFLEMTFAEQRH